VAPRTFFNRIDRVWIRTSPKCSCRSVSDFAWEVAQSKQIRCPIRSNIIVFRNPYKRVISGFLNKYVEHKNYLEASRRRNPQINLSTFQDFLEELYRSNYRYIDKLHFMPQISKHRWVSFDAIYDSDHLKPLESHINSMFETNIEMPFRVNKYGPKDGKSGETISDGAPCPENVWRLEREALLELIQQKKIPHYQNFFNDRLKGMVRELYNDDFRFLRTSLHLGVADEKLYTDLTSI
jgi:hypothetical protein